MSKLAIEFMRINSKRELPWFVGGHPHKGELVIVGGAPSLKNRTDIIAARQKDGATIVAMNGANLYLRSCGIEPDIVLFVDSSEAVVGFIGDDPDDCSIYLVSSTCHPDVFERLQNRDVHVWHPEIPPSKHIQAAILESYTDKPGVLLGGGSTGALRALSLGAALGYRTFHMYGVDSSYPRGLGDHAYTKHDGPEPAPMYIEFEGKTYCCSPWMVRQADEFRFYYAQMRSLGAKVYVHGDGLIPDICRWMKKIERSGKSVPMQMPCTIH